MQKVAKDQSTLDLRLIAGVSHLGTGDLSASIVFVDVVY